jgi:hypothetical protein
VRTRPTPWPPLPPRREVKQGLATALTDWQHSPTAAPAPDGPVLPGPAPEATRATLEAYAATVLPQDDAHADETRTADDVTAEERARDAVALVCGPDTAARPYLPAVAALLDARAADAARTGGWPEDGTASTRTGAATSPFAALDPEERTALYADLLTPGALDETEQQVLTLLSLLVHTAAHHTGRRPTPAYAVAP